MKPTPLHDRELKAFQCETCRSKMISIYLEESGKSYPYCKDCYQKQIAEANPEQSEQFKQATKRAEQMVKLCYYDLPITGANSVDQSKTFDTIDDIFTALTQELSLVLPSDWRSNEVLQCLEEACMWAKKSIAIYFKEKEKSDPKSNNTH